MSGLSGIPTLSTSCTSALTNSSNHRRSTGIFSQEWSTLWRSGTKSRVNHSCSGWQMRRVIYARTRVLTEEVVQKVSRVKERSEAVGCSAFEGRRELRSAKPPYRGCAQGEKRTREIKSSRRFGTGVQPTLTCGLCNTGAAQQATRHNTSLGLS